MKPIEKNVFSTSIYGIKLYKDDIEIIISKLQNNSGNFQISDDDNTYQDIEEVRKYKGDNPQIIKLQNRENFDYIFVRISDNIVSINCQGVAFLKEAYEIEKILLKRKKNPVVTYFFNPNNAKNNLIILTIFLSLYYFYKIIYLKQEFEIKNNFWGIGFWIIVLLITLTNQNFNGRIELKRKHESSFWEKNKDAILIATIIAIITAIITTIITKMTS